MLNTEEFEVADFSDDVADAVAHVSGALDVNAWSVVSGSAEPSPHGELAVIASEAVGKHSACAVEPAEIALELYLVVSENVKYHPCFLK